MPKASVPFERRCSDCGVPIPPTGRVGRPRKWCQACEAAAKATAKQSGRVCTECGGELPDYVGNGSPRKYCYACTVDHATQTKLWRDRSGYDARHATERREGLRGRGAFSGVDKGSPEDVYLLALAQDPCAYCGEPSTDLDHIVPAVHDVENVTAACRNCNQRKGTKSLLGFLIRRKLVAEGWDELNQQWRRVM